MRRSTLPLLRCPRCHDGPLLAEGEAERVRFGPVQCQTCGSTFPVADGILDLTALEASRPRRTLVQWLMESAVVARNYGRAVRPLFAELDAESEYVLLRALLAPAPGETLLDLSCGPAPHAWRLAQEPEGLRVIGLDRSAPMLQEARHLLSEVGAAVDLVRGEAAELPFRDGVLDAVLNVASLHLYPDAAAVLAEVARALRPGGRLVCVALLPERLQSVGKLEKRAGVVRHDEASLRQLCAAAGLERFERIRMGHWLAFRARRAA